MPARGADVQVVSVDGKFLRTADSRLFINGVTYGTFAPGDRSDGFPQLSQMSSDFEAMARHGVNTVRTYTVPPDEMLDCAATHGLGVMAGVPWAQHQAFLDDGRKRAAIRQTVVDHVRRLGRHPAVRLIAVGNEIPASVVRWHGPARISEYLNQIYDAAKSASPSSLLTYVNYPPTEHLEIPFFDVCAFNLYLHDRDALRAYLARLHHVAGCKPLLVAEAGADSLREGPDGQAALASMQLQEAFSAGACGAIAFAWTDEWWRGGFTVEDWAFGLVTGDRRPKPALHAVSRVFRQPHPQVQPCPQPLITVVVCAHNAAATIDECVRSLLAMRYPCAELLVIDDGSSDDTAAIVRRYPQVRLVQVPNRGLAAARNLGAHEARGEIVAYTDADVRVDPDWLTYLATAFSRPEVAAAGGPNVVPPDDSFLAQCVARAPGGPTHVMIDDHVAEHVPGCNLAVRKSALEAIGGFNPVFRRAGDDVDFCWRLQGRGWKVAFVPMALVWHRHRGSVGAYWRQQAGYGEGEVWLRPFHPGRFVGVRPTWRGHIYAASPKPASGRRVNAGVWGTAPFPSVYHTSAHPLAQSAHSAAWQLVSLLLVVVGLGLLPTAARSAGNWVLIAGLAALSVTVASCLRAAAATDLSHWQWMRHRPVLWRLRSRALIALLHFVQPLARAHGRIRGLLNPPNTQLPAAVRAPERPAAHLLLGPEELQFWGDSPISASDVLERVVRRLRARLTSPVEVDAGWWTERDVSVPVGRLARVDLRVLVEDHGAGGRLLRSSTALRASRWFAVVTAAAGALGVYGLLTPGLMAEFGAVVLLLISCWRLFAATRVARLIGTAVHDIAGRAGLERLTPTPSALRLPALRDRLRSRDSKQGAGQ